MRLRDVRALRRAAWSNPERGGVLCQDMCTSMLLPHLCQPPHAFVDVGAHIGSVTAEVRRRHPSMPIIAVEADPEKASSLARRFPDIEVHECAAGDRDAEETFYIDRRRPGYSSLARASRTNDDRVAMNVQMRRLDDLIPSTTTVGMIKIDVEGAELAVLRGATDLVARCRPVVVFESVPEAGEAIEEASAGLFDWFAGHDYVILVPDRVAHDGPPLHREGFIESHYYPRRSRNYFAVPADRRTEVRDRAREAMGVEVPHQP